jgi:Flp pilus assembly protein TadG
MVGTPLGRVRRPVRRLRDTSGANLLEAALVTPLVLFLTFAIIDFGAIFYVYLALENGVSQASRYAITGNQMSGQTREASIRQAMRDATPTLTLADSAISFSHMPLGGSSWQSGPGGPDDIGKVTVTYTWPIMTPLIRPLFSGGEFTFRVESTMKNEPRFD